MQARNHGNFEKRETLMEKVKMALRAEVEKVEKFLGAKVDKVAVRKLAVKVVHLRMPQP